MAPLFLLVFVLTLLYNLVRMARKPDERKRRGIRMGTWFIVLALSIALQSYWANASRNEADLVVQAVVAHQARKGAYPAELKEAGLDEQALKDGWSIRYIVREEKPLLVYPVPFMWLAMYEYDFGARKWRQNAD